MSFSSVRRVFAYSRISRSSASEASKPDRRPSITLDSPDSSFPSTHATATSERTMFFALGVMKPLLRRRCRRAQKQPRLVPVPVRLVRPLDRNAEVVGLLLRELVELHAELAEMKPRDLFVEPLRQDVHA